MKLIFAVLGVSITMGLTRCYKTKGFLHLYDIISTTYAIQSVLNVFVIAVYIVNRSRCLVDRVSDIIIIIISNEFD